MKSVRILSILLIFSSCIDINKKKCEEDFFSESEYKLAKTKLDDFKNRLAEYYVNKDDPSRQMIKMFWSNNKVQAIMYLKSKTKNGPFQNFDTSGKLYYSGFYLNDMQTGVSCYYDMSGNIQKMEVYNQDNKIGEVDSIGFKVK